MDKILQIILIITTILFAIFIIYRTSKKKLNYKLTILWLFFSLFIVILAIFPQIVIWMSGILHIETPVNALFLMFIFLLIVINFYLSIEMSKSQNRIITLTQELGILTKKVDDLKKEDKSE